MRLMPQTHEMDLRTVPDGMDERLGPEEEQAADPGRTPLGPEQSGGSAHSMEVDGEGADKGEEGHAGSSTGPAYSPELLPGNARRQRRSG